jgi:glutamate-5-semialdehyde dehydrogenase
MGEMRRLAERARLAARALARASTDAKNKALRGMAAAIRRNAVKILEANAVDLHAARELPASICERLMLDPGRIGEMARGIDAVADLPDPVGEILRRVERPNGLVIEKVRVPIGVIAIIYESRPNVTADASALCLKAGNASILRGGSEALRSNVAIGEIISEALGEAGLPPEAVQVLSSTDRDLVGELLGLSDLVDLVIPRGGKGLIRRVVEESAIPVIKHYEGICHVFVDRAADLGMAQAIVMNAKVQRPATCNAMETLLVHADVAADFLPPMASALRSAGVEMFGCARSRELVPWMSEATDENYRTEYLDLKLSVRVVDDLREAMDHIERFGSRHSDAIVTEDASAAREFLEGVDSACVFHNCSTRFSDGYQFGMGAEIGISTDKLHARGPMGLEELTSYKYIVRGAGQLRS